MFLFIQNAVNISQKIMQSMDNRVQMTSTR